MLSLSVTDLVIPTYQHGPNSIYPALSFSGYAKLNRPYPYTMQDDIDLATMTLDPQARSRAVILNNGILEAIILPDLNGRLYSLRHLASNREIFYRNNVIKPGLVALRGAWLSGGVEFNFPTLGHTVSTVSPVFFQTEQAPDHVAVIVGDIDRTTRQIWQVKMMLRPNRAALNIETTLYNPNHYRQRLYYWENAAVPATQDLRFICKCDWTVWQKAPKPFPIRDGKDISLHKNNPTPIDHFGYRSYADFFGAYYADSRAGTYHLALRNELPGQKYFTWGTGADDHIWEIYLTDKDGSYIEIQAGLLETQWATQFLNPSQTITTQGAWFGVQDADQLAWANQHIAVAVAPQSQSLDLVSIDQTQPLHVAVHTGKRKAAHVIAIEPGQTKHIPCKTAAEFTLEIRDHAGVLLMKETYFGPRHQALPPSRPKTVPTQWPLEPNKISVHSIENAEKYHHWAQVHELLEKHSQTLNPAQKNLALALLYLKTAQHTLALKHADQACLDNPADTTSHLAAAAAGLALQQASLDPAYHHAVRDHVLAARLDQRYQTAALTLLAESTILLDNLPQARDILASFLPTSNAPENLLAVYLAVLRHLGDTPTAAARLSQQTPLLPYLANEAYLLDPAKPLRYNLPANPDALADQSLHQVEMILESLLPYFRLNLVDDLETLLTAAAKAYPVLRKHPTTHLLRCAVAGRRQKDSAALQSAKAAEACSTLYIFPHRSEELQLLETALALLKKNKCPAPNLTYLLGLALAQNDRPQAAVKKFQAARRSKSSPANLLSHKALAEWAQFALQDVPAAINHLRAAVKLNPKDRRLVLQLDTLYSQCQQITPRAKLLAQIPTAWKKRGDVTYHLARLAFDQQRYNDALALMIPQQFTVYEGATNIRRLYVDVILASALTHIAQSDYDRARELLPLIFEFPKNLGAASYLGEHSRLARFLLGLADARQNHPEPANKWFQSVLDHSKQVAAYTVGDAATARALRPDEWLAIQLAAQQLKTQTPASSSLPDTTALAPMLQSAWQLAHAIADHKPNSRILAAAAFKTYPCHPLMAILHKLAPLV